MPESRCLKIKLKERLNRLDKHFTSKELNYSEFATSLKKF